MAKKYGTTYAKWYLGDPPEPFPPDGSDWRMCGCAVEPPPPDSEESIFLWFWVCDVPAAAEVSRD